MNNLSNYDMFSRSLKEEKDAYEQRFTDKQDEAASSNSLLVEGLTIPFIESSGQNIIKKGLRMGAKKMGLSDDVIKSVQSIGEDIKSGNWSDAGRKIANARKNPLFSPEQQKFLNEKQNALDSLRGKPKVQTTPVTEEDVNKRFGELSQENKDIAMKKTRLLKFDDYEGQSKILDDIGKKGGSVFETLSESLPKVVPKVPKVAIPSLVDTSDVLSLPKGLSMNDAATGKALNPVKQIVQPTQTAIVKEDDGTIITDSNELERQKLEDRLATGEEGEGETKALQSRLRTMIGKTSAEVELSPQARATQSVKSFLKKYKKATPEDTGITPTSASKPLINPRDVAEDLNVPEGSGYARGLNGYKIDARNIKAKAKTVLEPQYDDISKLPPPGDELAMPIQEEPPSKAQLDTLARAAKGDYTSKNATRSAELKDNYSKLSDNGQKIYADKVDKAGLDRFDYDGRQQLIQEADVQDKAQIAQVSQVNPEPPKPTQTQSEVPDPSSSKTPVTEPDAPIVEDKPTVVEDFGKALEKGATVDAELGGPEDIVGDAISGAIAIGSLIFGLNSAHKDNTPPPIKQINPTLQYGTGQI